MNIYIVVEGETATKKIYKRWIPLINPDLHHIDYIKDVRTDSFYILAGYGQPYFLERVEGAIKDVNDLQSFDRLVIAVDSEDMEPFEKQLQVSRRVDAVGCRVEVRYIVQHFCLETWLLGNRQIFRRKPQDPELVSFTALFNIRVNDPADLPENRGHSWNRSQFAYHYLRSGIRDIYRGQRASYTKRNPGIVVENNGYFRQLQERCIKYRHILSFEDFLNAFV